jgi:tetratricopeptide (TPR) repeat protein
LRRRARGLSSAVVRFLSLVFLLGLLAAPARAESPPPAAEVVAAARALLAASRLPEAREPLEGLLAREPRHLEAALLLASVYNGLGHRDQAIELLDPFLERHPENHRLLGLYAGQCLLRAGELGGGFRALRLARRGSDLMERAVALAPADIAYREGLVDFYRQAPRIAGGSLDKARKHAEAITRLDPVRGAAWQASILIQEKRYAEALAACDAALAARPDDYVALFTLGRTVAESGLRLADGEAALHRCLASTPTVAEPSHASVWYRLGLIAEHREAPDAARAAYRRSLALEPNFPSPAEALRRLGE